VAEISCNKPWAHIKAALDRLQVTKFENSSYRLFHRNELPAESNFSKSPGNEQEKSGQYGCFVL